MGWFLIESLSGLNVARNTITYIKLDPTTNFHPNLTNFARACYRGGFRVGGVCGCCLSKLDDH